MNIRIVAGIAAFLLCTGCVSPNSTSSPTDASNPTPRQTSEITPSADPTEPSPTASTEEAEPHSEASSDPTSIHALVNKHHALEPEDFEPEDLTELEVPQQYGGQRLREEAAATLEELVAAAANDEVELWVTTAYRNYEHQQGLYKQQIAAVGQDAADELVARPGYSEHQTGLAVDMSFDGNQDCKLHACFAETPQGQWLAENAHEFGFIIRYPDGTDDITGYSYEPWHLRYVGEPTAEEVTSQEITLEEYWDVPAAPDYQD